MLENIFKDGISLTETERCLLLWRISDIEKWVIDALVGNVNHCKMEFMQEWIPRLQQDSSLKSIPCSVEDLVSMVVKREDYKNRSQRDEEYNDQKLLKETSNFQVQ